MQVFQPNTLEICRAFARNQAYEGPRIPSCLHRGFRVRAVGNRLFYRPETETFAEFKYQHLRLVLGKNWWMHQAKQPHDQMHVIMQCAVEYHRLAKASVPEGHQPGEVFSAAPTNACFELLQLSDDVLRLCASGSDVPAHVLSRLRKLHGFQGARFELFVAGLLLRCGFRLEWLDRQLKAGEFQVRDPRTGESFCVEVKSRHRPGALHQPGPRQEKEALEADLDNLLKSAFKQCRLETANVVFIDANLPMTEESTVGWRYWDSVDAFMKRVPQRSRAGAAYPAFFLGIIANGWHWHPTEDVENPPVATALLSPCNQAPSNPNTLIRLAAAAAFPPPLPERIYE